MGLWITESSSVLSLAVAQALRVKQALQVRLQTCCRLLKLAQYLCRYHPAHCYISRCMSCWTADVLAAGRNDGCTYALQRV